MKKFLEFIACLALLFMMTGCVDTDNGAKDNNGNKKTDFEISEVAVLKNSTIKINSVKRIDKECLWEYDKKCQSYTEPKNDYFLLIDLTIENTSSEQVDVSSLLSFDLKTDEGEKMDMSFLLKAVKSQLDSSIMPNDKLKGQIAFDVKNS